MLDGTRQWLNVSREGIDDLEDLLDLRLISILRLSTAKYGYITAYSLTELGIDLIKTISEELKREVRNLLYGECKQPRPILIHDRKFYFKCPESDKEVYIPIDEIEDVPYRSEAYLPTHLSKHKNTSGGDKR